MYPGQTRVFGGLDLMGVFDWSIGGRAGVLGGDTQANALADQHYKVQFTCLSGTWSYATFLP